MTPSELSAWLTRNWATEATTGAVDCEGAHIHYRGWNLSDRSKPGLLLAHGFLAHARWWDHIAPSLADRYRVIAPDFSGMGESDRRASYSRRQYGRELLAVAKAADFDRITFVSHSFGSVSALFAAKSAPEVTERVIVIDANIFQRLNRDATPAPGERTFPDSKAALSRFRFLPPLHKPVDQIVSYIAQHSIRRSGSGWGWKFDPRTYGTFDNEDIGEELRVLGIPIDLIRGAQSTVLDAAAAAALARNFLDCGEPVAIPNCGHHVMVEQPVALVMALNSLLTQQRRAA